jgi:hypothetical protein
MTYRFRIMSLALAGALVSGFSGVAFAAADHGAWGGQAGSNWKNPAEQGMRATHALNMLEDQRETPFNNFHADGRNFVADVMKDGKTTPMMINPDNGQISPTNTTMSS